jgi:hypothetical protein
VRLLTNRDLDSDFDAYSTDSEAEAREGDWLYDCECGYKGNLDHGRHSIQCESCDIWQHIK